MSGLVALVLALVLLVCARCLWALRWSLARDPACALPLPRGSMGWPLVGETFHWLIQGSEFHSSRRQRYGSVFKTHLLGKPVIRVSGAEHVRKILLGEHALVSTQWPRSTRIILGRRALANATGELHRVKRKILAKVFSRAALECYLPRLQEAVRAEVLSWCSRGEPVELYSVSRALTFRVAMRVLLGLRLDEQRELYLSRIFESLMNNLFSLPVDAPFSGLRKGKRARNILHAAMEDILKEKLGLQQVQEYCDAFDFMLSAAKEINYDMSMDELKETAVELIFAAHSTTASASTSLVLQLLHHPEVAERARAELEAEGLVTTMTMASLSDAHVGSCRLRCRNEGVQKQGNEEEEEEEEVVEKNEEEELCSQINSKGQGQTQLLYLSLEKLNRLQYLDCVVKEVLRFLPPVSGGYRTVLQTFELDGYQIPKGWSVMYSIRDTHETAAAYRDPELFDPARFGRDRDEARGSRFSYVAFGGGARVCVGRELALMLLKTLSVELLSNAEMSLASRSYPRMQTVPIVHPVGGLHVRFGHRSHTAHAAGGARNRRQSAHI